MFKIDQPQIVVDESLDLLNELSKRRIKSTDNIKACEYVMKIDNVNKFSKGNISGWIGRAKSKKSFAITMFTAALCGGFNLYNKFKALKKCVVLYVDTEQSDDDVQLVTKRIKEMVGDETNLLMYGLRPFNPEKRIKSIETLLNQHKVDVLIIDGVRDLVYDINDAVECTNVMTDLMRWSSDFDIHIAAVLHQNKGNDNARGHIGTELENKSQALLKITKDEQDVQISWFEEVFGRGKGIERFQFFVNNNYADFGIPEVIDSLLIPIDEDDEPF